MQYWCSKKGGDAPPTADNAPPTADTAQEAFDILVTAAREIEVAEEVIPSNLETLDLKSLKKVRQAAQTIAHPDKHGMRREAVQRAVNEMFTDISNAAQHLKTYLKGRMDA